MFPHVYKNTLYRQVDEDHTPFASGLLDRIRAPSRDHYSQTSLYNYDSRNSGFASNSLFFTLIKNPIVMILVVVVVSYLISFIAGRLLGMDSGITGLIEMLVALLLSYGLSLYADRNSDFIVKGTFIFFISLIILILLIFV